jgi:alpha-glucosidase (family GH31 glycosyl hydrolase)
MTTPRLLRILGSALPAAMLFAAAPVWGQAAVETLESPALKLEVHGNPYSYRVIEKSSGETLLEESGGAWFTRNQYAVRTAGNFTRANQGLAAALHLDGTSTPADVTFRFLAPEVLEVTLAFNGGIPAEIAEEFTDAGEHYYGIWEMPFGGNIDNRGADHDFLGIRHQPDVNYSSARAPFYATSRKYGIYVQSTGAGHYRIAEAGKTSFRFDDTRLRYDIIYGTSYAEIFKRYNALAGPPVMPPLWAFSSIWWRDDQHEDLRRANNAQEKVLDDAEHLRSLHLPAGAIWLDRPYGSGEMGWGNMDFDAGFPDPEKMIHDLEERGMKLLIWVANRTWNQLFSEGSASRYLYFGKGSAADMKSPAAYSWFKRELHEYVRLGVRGYKIDRGEEDELSLADENLNAILFPRMAAEGLSDVYGADFFEFTRNVNDTGRRYTAVWNGDTRSTFAGLEVSLKTALRSGAINFPMWGSDTGGYIRVPEKELFARWLAFSAYSSMMEILIGPKRTIWDDYDDELVRIAQTHVSAHHDLIPYTRSFLYQSTRSGMPVMRALIFSFPADESVSDTWNEYLFGSEILVAPVTTAHASERKVYLPAGRWLDYNDKQTVYAGPATITAKAALAEIPLFVREGAIVPRGDIVKVNNNWDQDWKPRLRIEFFPAENQGSEFLYYTGSAEQKITAARTKDGLEIEFGDLGSAGTLEVYCGKVARVTRNGQKLQAGKEYRYDAAAKRLTLGFDGPSNISIEAARSLFGASGSR